MYGPAKLIYDESCRRGRQSGCPSLLFDLRPMRIRSLTAFEIPIQLRSPVRHASFTRDHNDTLIIRCELTDGNIGWGEGLPRTYVTGESIESVWRHLSQTNFAQLADVSFGHVSDVVQSLDEFQLADVAADAGIAVRSCFGNSVRCALELALLDSVCRSNDCSVATLFETIQEAQDLLRPQDMVRYSGVVTATSGMKQWRSALKMKLYGFHAVKVKVGAAGVSDAAFLKRIRRVIGAKVNVRLDANEAWHCDEVVDRMTPLLPYELTSLEQPVPHAEIDGLPDVRLQLAVPIMLDESLCSLDDAKAAIRAGSCDLFNLRISKCGGLVNCVRLVSLAKRNELGYQLGCQVGETGILSAAGRHFACNIDGIRYLEGSYDRFLVKERLTTEDLTFRFSGKAPRLTTSGLGVTVNEKRIRQLAVRTLNLI